MKLFRLFTVAALSAALLFLVGAVSADCPNDDPRCTILPPVSREVGSPQSEGLIASGSTESTSLTTLDQIVPMAPPPYVPTSSIFSAKDGQPSAYLTFDRFNIPIRYQEHDDRSCGAQALGMALDGLSGIAPRSSSLWSFLLNQGMTYAFGTGVEELAHTAQSFGYAGSLPFHNASLADLQAELRAGRPVVVSLGANPENGIRTRSEDRPGHFVTLTGVSPEGAWVSYNDPIIGKVVLSTEEFMALWGAQGHSGVSVAVEAPVTPNGELNVAPWIALAAGLMALVSTTPMVLGRKGIGGRLDLVGVTGASTGDPPNSAPPGFKWKKTIVTKYKLAWVQDGWSFENRTVPRYERQRVQVGTKTVYDKIPKFKIVRVQDGWKTVYDRVAQYKTVRYVKYYHTTQKKVKRYRFVRGRRNFAGYSYITKRTPVYGTKSIFNGYKKVSKRIPNYMDKRVPDGFKVVETEVPNYEWKDVKIGWTTEKVRVPKMVQMRQPDGVEVKWELEKYQDPLDIESSVSKNWADLETTPSQGEARTMQTSNPLRIRADAGMDGTVLCYALEHAPIHFMGDYKEIDGTVWYRVEYQDKYKGTVVGWVSSKFLRDHPKSIEKSVETPPAVNDHSASSSLWYHSLSPQERAEYIAQEMQKFERLVVEIERLIGRFAPELHRNIPVGHEYDPFDGLRVWQAQVRQLIAEPDWFSSQSMPPSFNGQFGFNAKQATALRALLQGLSNLNIPLSDSTIQIIGDAFGVGSADVVMQGLKSGPEYWHGGLSAGDLPVTLRVHDRDGVRLRMNPSDSSALVPGPFNGIPYHDTVEWSGAYSIGMDGHGSRRVYYQVTFEWNDRYYEGWVPSEYFSPPVEKELGRSESSGGYRRTYGYDQEGGWADYHAGGAAQNLNVWKIFEEIGYEFEDGVNPFPTVHHNLCGQLAVMEALGVSLEEGFEVFVGIGEKYEGILQDPQRESFSLELAEFISGFNRTTIVISGNPQMESQLDAGHKILALVTTLNGNVHSEGNSAHWVHVSDYNQTVVKFYNPYTNQKETIDRRLFDVAWRSTPGNSESFVAVIANP